MSKATALLDAPLARVLLLGLLVVVLQIPACMIGQLGQARQASRDEAAAEIATHWGGAQNLLGPFLVVPYTIHDRDKDGKPFVRGGFVVEAPETLSADVVAAAETRSRGLFHIPVYRASARLHGRFRAPITALPPLDGGAELHWDQAQLVVRLCDAHAIDEVAPLSIQKQAYPFEPGGGALAAAGLHATLGALRAGEPADFDLTLAFRGSDQLRIAPSGLDTDVTLKSNWPDPTFQGAWLPFQRDVGASGFTAQWHVPYVARGLPAAWQTGAVGDDQLNPTLFGAGFVPPVDAYRMAERSLKYSALFIGLAFLLVWLFEVVGGARVHPVQYLLLGAALCLFYLLELSLAEHLGFELAYVLASAAVTTQVTLYSRSALGGRRPLVMGTVTATLYGLLYLLLREDDYALLVGSLSLFAILSAVMFLTRRVKWGPGAPSGEAPPAQRLAGSGFVGG